MKVPFCQNSIICFQFKYIPVLEVLKNMLPLNINYQIETNPKTISEAFNKFFSTIAKDIDNKIIPIIKTLFE